jgi:hypothetical protein
VYLSSLTSYDDDDDDDDAIYSIGEICIAGRKRERKILLTH